jgi:hypothetical protein
MESDITLKLKRIENYGDCFIKNRLFSVFVSPCIVQWEIDLQWHTSGMDFGDILY